MNEKFYKDIKIVVDGGEQSKELKNMVKAVRQYVGTEQVTSETDLVNFLLLQSAITNVSEEVWERTVIRLHRILIIRKTGIDPYEIIQKSNRSTNQTVRSIEWGDTVANWIYQYHVYNDHVSFIVSVPIESEEYAINFAKRVALDYLDYSLYQLDDMKCEFVVRFFCESFIDVNKLQK